MESYKIICEIDDPEDHVGDTVALKFDYGLVSHPVFGNGHLKGLSLCFNPFVDVEAIFDAMDLNYDSARKAAMEIAEDLESYGIESILKDPSVKRLTKNFSIETLETYSVLFPEVTEGNPKIMGAIHLALGLVWISLGSAVKAGEDIRILVDIYIAALEGDLLHLSQIKSLPPNMQGSTAAFMLLRREILNSKVPQGWNYVRNECMRYVEGLYNTYVNPANDVATHLMQRKYMSLVLAECIWVYLGIDIPQNIRFNPMYIHFLSSISLYQDLLGNIIGLPKGIAGIEPEGIISILAKSMPFQEAIDTAVKVLEENFYLAKDAGRNFRKAFPNDKLVEYIVSLCGRCADFLVILHDNVECRYEIEEETVHVLVKHNDIYQKKEDELNKFLSRKKVEHSPRSYQLQAELAGIRLINNEGQFAKLGEGKIDTRQICAGIQELRNGLQGIKSTDNNGDLPFQIIQNALNMDFEVLQGLQKNKRLIDKNQNLDKHDLQLDKNQNLDIQELQLRKKQSLDMQKRQSADGQNLDIQEMQSADNQNYANQEFQVQSTQNLDNQELQWQSKQKLDPEVPNFQMVLTRQPNQELPSPINCDVTQAGVAPTITNDQPEQKTPRRMRRNLVLKDSNKKCNVNHLALIPDGNRRWARSHGMSPLKGHWAGVDAIDEVVKTSFNLGIHTVTIWILSPTNFKRSKSEFENLCEILRIHFNEFRKMADRFDARIACIGKTERLAKDLQDTFAKQEEETKDRITHRLNIAVDYDGKQEIVHAVEKIKNSETATSCPTTPEEITKNLWGGNQPYPEPNLIVRTGAKDSGTYRTSGFMIWQAAQTEFYFENKYLPEVGPEEVAKWLGAYEATEKRSGL